MAEIRSGPQGKWLLPGSREASRFGWLGSLTDYLALATRCTPHSALRSRNTSNHFTQCTVLWPRLMVHAWQAIPSGVKQLRQSTPWYAFIPLQVGSLSTSTQVSSITPNENPYSYNI